MAASVVAAATPTPGGAGGFEAAAIAGLTGIGISSGAAVAASSARCGFSRRCYSQPHPFGKIKSISPNGRVVPLIPQLVGL